jgi:hypothetical protein
VEGACYDYEPSLLPLTGEYCAAFVSQKVTGERRERRGEERRGEERRGEECYGG